MSGVTCNACNKRFESDAEQKLHYRSDWHRYNLKRKVAGVPGVTEPLFLARQAAEESHKLNGDPLSYTCVLCEKAYKSSKAYSQHQNSKAHASKVSHAPSSGAESVIIKPLQHRETKLPAIKKREIDLSESSEDEWEVVDEGDDLDEAMESLNALEVKEPVLSDKMDVGNNYGSEFEDDLNPTCCFMCDEEHDTIESCIVHMHKHHGFFIPDIEYLKDPKGLLTYLGLKVRRDFLCLYCNYKCQPFNSLEAVRKHMVCKSHCKVHYGDGDDDEEAELEDFYDYSSSYMDTDKQQPVAADHINTSTALGTAGAELIIVTTAADRTVTKILGSRDFIQYYRQKPRPFPNNSVALAATLASRYKSMGLVTMHPKVREVRKAEMEARNRVEALRTKVGIRNNVIWNLPKNVPH